MHHHHGGGDFVGGDYGGDGGGSQQYFNPYDVWLPPQSQGYMGGSSPIMSAMPNFQTSSPNFVVENIYYGSSGPSYGTNGKKIETGRAVTVDEDAVKKETKRREEEKNIERKDPFDKAARLWCDHLETEWQNYIKTFYDDPSKLADKEWPKTDPEAECFAVPLEEKDPSAGYGLVLKTANDTTFIYKLAKDNNGLIQGSVEYSPRDNNGAEFNSTTAVDMVKFAMLSGSKSFSLNPDVDPKHKKMIQYALAKANEKAKAEFEAKPENKDKVYEELRYKEKEVKVDKPKNNHKSGMHP